MAKASGKPIKTSQAKASYRDLDPVEQGGRVARDGFDYQDHVAVGKCLDMIHEGGPTEVWCEAEDDIVPGLGGGGRRVLRVRSGEGK